MTMLWHPGLGFPWPSARAEWLGLAAGFLFALGNVLVRRLDGIGDAAKSIAIWAGVGLAAAAWLPASATSSLAAMQAAWSQWPIVAGIGASLVAMGLALQYGLSRMPANRAIVILLFELVVAAVASWLLAGESLGTREWLGGLLIAGASLASGVVESRARRA
jgi:drug/metabolite transporter (DMT)-like permease